MVGKIAVLATLDTKGPEAQFIKDYVREHSQFDAILIDLGFQREPLVAPDISREEVVSALGLGKEIFSKKMRRDEFVDLMGKGAGRILTKLYSTGELRGVIGIGGNQGTAAACIAMRALPLGFPKVMVSTVASGDIRPFVGYSDIAFLFSISDVEFGPNFITKTILTNAAAAVVSMAMAYKPIGRVNNAVAISTLGSTGILTRNVAAALRNMGFEPVVFHASGAGGSAMEELIENGFFTAALDLNLHELVGEVFKEDIYRPLKPRLNAAAKLNIPTLVAPGSINYFVFGPPDTVPAKYIGRKTHYHNPYNTNVRLNRDELRLICQALMNKLRQFRRRIPLLVPLRGFSVLDGEGGELYEPETDMEFIGCLKEHRPGNVELIEIDDNINGKTFVVEVIGKFKELINA